MSTISVGGKRLNEEAAIALLKDVHIKPTKAHLERLTKLTTDTDKNKYLNKSELDRGVMALLLELHGGQSGGVSPDKPIKAAIDGVPLGTARYQVSLSDARPPSSGSATARPSP